MEIDIMSHIVNNPAVHATAIAVAAYPVFKMIALVFRVTK